MNKLLKPFFLICLVIGKVGTAQSTDKTQYSFNVDNFPEMSGGKEEMKRFLHDHLVYPAEDLKNKKEGTVLLNFVVTKEGKAVNIQVVKPVTPAIDKEAVRLIKLIEWIPAQKEGNVVNVNYNSEINFSPSKYKKQVKERGFDAALYTDLPIDTSLNVYDKTEERPPVFNNTDKGFTEFVYTNLEYPEIALRQNIEGNIKLSFVVEPDGQVSNIKIMNGGLSGGCNNEAIRVIGLTKWQPAIRDKQYVRYRMNFTMNFSVKNNFKDNSNGSQRSWGQ